MNFKKAKNRFQSGLGRVEVMGFIGVVGGFLAFVVPAASEFIADSVDTKNRRNARMLATISASAQVAGLDLVVSGDMIATIEKIVNGAVVESGQFKGERFALPGLSRNEWDEAAHYLAIQADVLVYNSGPD
ncbi:MAG: hypothetical protein ACC661_03260 [Verrucomicrobiales bacterium]